jgi:polyisoprenoid-binding protein YceI
MHRRFSRTIGSVSILLVLAVPLAGILVARQRISTRGETTTQERGPDPVELLGEDVALLRSDVQALTHALNERMGELHESLAEQALERDPVLRAEIRALAEGLARLQVDPAEATAPAAPPPGPCGSSPAPDRDGSGRAETEAVEIPSPPAADVVAATAPLPPSPGKRFLSFELPSQSFSFDLPQVFDVVPSLSRVGFDAKSTLHDFSGTTSAVEGRLTVCLADPATECRGEIRMRVAALNTENPSRDEGLREHLLATENPEIAFAIERFEPDAVDRTAQTVRGTVHGTMTIRGVARPLAMPVAAAIDSGKRLSIDGEVGLDLRDYRIPVPSKLGMISMEPVVKVWIALRARCSGAPEPHGS